MPTLYDRQGSPVELEPDEAAAALASGEYGVPKDATVPVFSPGGEVGHVQGDKIHDALASGYKLATDEDVASAQREAKYGGLVGGVKAAALEGASTATLGLSDVAGSAIGGDEFREARKGYREANPKSSIAGGLIGAVAPLVLTGGAAAPEEAAIEGANLVRAGAEGAEAAGEAGALARAGGAIKGAGSAAAKVATAPSRLMGAAGEAVEGAVKRALGSSEGTSLAAALAKRALVKGAGVATEGAFVGAGEYASEHALDGDPDVNGEKLFASIGHGALLGLGAAAGLTSAGALGRAVLGRVAPAVSRMAEGQAVRSVLEGGRRGAFVKELDRIQGGARAAGRQMLDDGVLAVGDKLEQVAPKLSQARGEWGERVGKILDAADEAGIEGPKLAELRAQVENTVSSELRKLPKTNASAIKRVEGLMGDLDSFLGVPSAEEAAAKGLDVDALREQRLTFRQAQEFRQTLGKRINWKRPPPGSPIDEANEVAKDVYRIVEGSVEQAGDKAAKELGGNFLDQYREAKLAYQRYAVLDRAAQEGLSAKLANRALSPSDYGTGAAVGAGLLSHAAALGPAGVAVAGAKAVGAAVAHRVLRERGNSTAAVLLDKVAALRGIEAARDRVDTQIDRSLARLFRGSSRELARPAVQVAALPIGLAEPEEEHRAGKVLHEGTHYALGAATEGQGGERGGERAALAGEERPVPGEHPYRDHVRAIQRAAEAPAAHAQRIEDAAAPITKDAPETSRAFQSAAIRATAYLAKQIPHNAAERPTLTPQLDTPRLSATDQRRYVLIAHAVHDPMSVMADLAEGRATRAQIDALREVYPALYSEIVTRIQERLEKLKEPPALATRRQLGLLYGAAADPTRDPAFGARMQEDFAPKGAPAAPQGGAPKGGAPKRKLEGRSDSLGLPGSREL